MRKFLSIVFWFTSLLTTGMGLIIVVAISSLLGTSFSVTLFGGLLILGFFLFLPQVAFVFLFSIQALKTLSFQISPWMRRIFFVEFVFIFLYGVTLVSDNGGVSTGPTISQSSFFSRLLNSSADGANLSSDLSFFCLLGYTACLIALNVLIIRLLAKGWNKVT